MGDFGELGPLDIQMRKTDELWETSSGLNVSAALTQIENRVCESFSRFFIDMKGRFQLSTKTASEIATKLSEGIYEGIAEQIDPIQLGEANRSIGIAQHYGESLNRKSKNLKDGALARLIATYPSHSYVIDCEEASSLFNNVRTPTDKEANLFKILDVLFNLSTVVDSSQDSVIRNVREMIAVFKELQTQEEAQTANTTRLAQMQDDDSMHQQVSLTKRTLNGASNGQGDSDVNEVQCGAPIQSAVSTRRSAGQERTTSKIVKTA
jgi:hypothetical protein